MNKTVWITLCLVGLLTACNTTTTEEKPAVQPVRAKEAPATAEPVQAKEPSSTNSKESVQSASKGVEQPKAAEQPQAISTTQSAPPSQPKPKPAVPEAAASKPVTQPPAPQPQKTEEKKEQSVTLSIQGDSEHGAILGQTKVEIEEGDMVIDLLKRVVKEKNIQMEFSGSGPLVYVEGIDNLYEFDQGPKSGWMYRVNGVFGPKSAGSIEVKAGDRIEWLYTLDLGKDLGAGTP